MPLCCYVASANQALPFIINFLLVVHIWYVFFIIAYLDPFTSANRTCNWPPPSGSFPIVAEHVYSITKSPKLSPQTPHPPPPPPLLKERNYLLWSEPRMWTLVKSNLCGCRVLIFRFSTNQIWAQMARSQWIIEFNITLGQDLCSWCWSKETWVLGSKTEIVPACISL